jgi:chitodextrinase
MGGKRKLSGGIMRDAAAVLLSGAVGFAAAHSPSDANAADISTTVAWDYPRNETNDIKAFQVGIWPLGSGFTNYYKAPLSNVGTNRGDKVEFFHRFTNLIPNTAYGMTVRAVGTNNEVSEPNPVISMTTGAISPPPEPPSNAPPRLSIKSIPRYVFADGTNLPELSVVGDITSVYHLTNMGLAGDVEKVGEHNGLLDTAYNGNGGEWRFNARITNGMQLAGTTRRRVEVFGENIYGQRGSAGFDIFMVPPGDADGDGIPDFGELVGGWDPADAGSSLRLSVQRNAAGGNDIHFTGARGATNSYRLEKMITEATRIDIPQPARPPYERPTWQEMEGNPGNAELMQRLSAWEIYFEQLRNWQEYNSFSISGIMGQWQPVEGAYTNMEGDGLLTDPAPSAAPSYLGRYGINVKSCLYRVVATPGP